MIWAPSTVWLKKKQRSKNIRFCRQAPTPFAEKREGGWNSAFSFVLQTTIFSAKLRKLALYRVATKERMFLKWVVVACDFFLWGYLESKVYVRKPRTVDDLKVSIREEIATVPQEIATVPQEIAAVPQ